MKKSPQAWREILDLVDTSICGRIARSMVMTIGNGGEVMFGEVSANASGLHLRSGRSTTSVAWDEIGDTNIGDDTSTVVTELMPRRSKSDLAMRLDEWNVVVLPHVLRVVRRDR